MEFGFAGVATVPTSFEVIGYYYGPAVVRQLNVQVWNYDNNSWVSLGVMPRVTVDYVTESIEPLPAYSFPIPSGPESESFLSGGEMMIRLDQPQNGNQDHLLYLDRVWLRY